MSSTSAPRSEKRWKVTPAGTVPDQERPGRLLKIMQGESKEALADKLKLHDAEAPLSKSLELMPMPG